MDRQSVRSTSWGWPLLWVLLALPTLSIGGCEGVATVDDPSSEPPILVDDEWRSIGRWLEHRGEAPAENRLARRAQEVFAKLRPVFDNAGGRLYVLAPAGGSSRGDAPFAAALPDGNVVLNWEGLELCYEGVPSARGDSRLALVLAHELSHLQADHQWFLDAKAMALSLEGEEDVIRALQEDLGSNAQETRKLELQADAAGVIGMTIAGYDPGVVLGADESFFAEWVGTVTGQLAYQDDSHPSPEERDLNAEQRLRRAAAMASVFYDGSAAYDTGDYEASIRAFAKVKQLFPSHKVLSNLGLAHYQLAARALANCDGMLVATWRLPVELDQETILDRSRLRGSERSECYDRDDYLDHLQAAEENLMEALEIDPEYPVALKNLVAVHMLDDQPFRALSLVEAAIRLAPGDPDFQMARAVVRVADELSRDRPVGDYASELEDLHRRNPENPNIAFNAAQALSFAGEFERAEPVWRAFLELEPDGEWAEIARWKVGDDQETAADSDQLTK